MKPINGLVHGLPPPSLCSANKGIKLTPGMDAKPIKGRNGPYPKFSSEILTIPYFSFSPNFVIHIENLSNPNRKQLSSFILKIFLKV